MGAVTSQHQATDLTAVDVATSALEHSIKATLESFEAALLHQHSGTLKTPTSLVRCVAMFACMASMQNSLCSCLCHFTALGTPAFIFTG